MKLKTLTGACMLAFSATPAFALTPAVTGQATTVRIFMSGASAQLNTITQLFETMCATTPSRYNVTGNTNMRGVSCTIAPGVSDLAGRNVFLSYNASGGSGNGVYPIAKQVDSGGALSPLAGNLVEQIRAPQNCTGVAAPYTCNPATAGTIVGTYSDAGISDVEPALFVFPLNRPALFVNDELQAFELANLDVGSQFQVIFGIAATNNLYADLAAAQGLSTGAGQVPSMSKSSISSLLAGALADPASGLGWQALFTPGTLPAGSAVTGAVNIGRRVNGSGTQTAANAFFLDYGCSPTANLSPADALSSGGLFVVDEGSGTSNVISFLNARNAAGQYAIGLVSKENSSVGQGWQHVAIDGIVASRDNAKNGKYEYVYEQTMQWNNSYLDNFRTAQYPLPAGVTLANLKSFLSTFRVRSGSPSVLNLLPAATQEGNAALANVNAGYIFNDPNSAVNKRFVSRVTRNGSSCQRPIWLQ